MISLKSPREIEAMRRAGRITAQARALAGSMVRPGVTTHEIDTAVRRFIESHGAKPSFLGYGGFPGSACISVNEEVIHGIPGPRKLKEGDIVSVDVGAFIGGFHGDCAATYPCGEVSDEAKRLIAVTQQSFWEGIKMARQGCRVSDIGHAVQEYVEANGFSVVRDFVGHGVGAKLHEAPEVRNFGPAGHGPRLLPGMTIAVEPMVCAGGWQVKVLADKWTTVSLDGSLTAHYENSILITEGDPEILTVTEDGAYDYTGWIVQATAGRDQGDLFCVVGVDQEQQRLLLADGKRRKVARPKRKKLGHVTPLTERLRGFDHPAVRKLQEGEPVSDRELRRALAAFKEGISLGER